MVVTVSLGDFVADQFSHKDGMKPVVADEQPCY